MKQLHSMLRKDGWERYSFVAQEKGLHRLTRVLPSFTLALYSRFRRGTLLIFAWRNHFFD